MADTLFKILEIETSLAQQEAGIRVKNAENKTLLAKQAAWKALRDEQSWTSTRLKKMTNRSKKKDTKLTDFRQAVSKKGVEMVVEKNQVI